MREGDLRIGKSDWVPEKLSVISEWVKSSLSPIAKRLGVTLGQLSISWALHQDFMGFVIVGNTKPEYTSINLKANDIKLSARDLEEIEKAYVRLEDEIKAKYDQSIREFRGLNEKFY